MRVWLEKRASPTNRIVTTRTVITLRSRTEMEPTSNEFVAHAGKAGARTLINVSPEPLTNVAVSTGEDVATAGLLTLAIVHPISAAIIAVALVLLSVWLVIAARRALKRLLEPKRRAAG